jgi:hypothetical protein
LVFSRDAATEGKDCVKRILACTVAALYLAWGATAQKVAPPASLPPPASAQNQEFLQAADEVLAEMSKLISLPILSPLKKSMRSREEIRAYLLQKMNEDKDADKRYADQKTMEKFGLLPKSPDSTIPIARNFSSPTGLLLPTNDR